MDKHIEVVGVDHGWSGMKTVSQVFTTGVKEITTEPAFFNNVVEYNGSYYKVGGKRLEVRDLKVENDNFYLLTLAAVAKELNRRGMRNANILLSVGLPLTRFGAEKQDFIDYLSRNKEVTFRFDNEQYRINLARVSVFPQCYAAVADRMKTLPKRVVVVDIGSWTIDIMPIEDSAPNEAECITLREGLIKCMGNGNRVSLSMSVTQSDIDTINSIISNNDTWSVTNNCSSFAVKVWNSVSSNTLSAGSPNTPTSLMSSIKSKSGYQTGRSIGNTTPIGYVSNGSFVTVTMTSAANFSKTNDTAIMNTTTDNAEFITPIDMNPYSYTAE